MVTHSDIVTARMAAFDLSVLLTEHDALIANPRDYWNTLNIQANELVMAEELGRIATALGFRLEPIAAPAEKAVAA